MEGNTKKGVGLLIIALLCLTPLLGHRTNTHYPKDPVSFHTDFEGGNLGSITKISKSHWKCAIAGESDSKNRNRQASWYYFRMDNVKNKTLTIELTDLVGEYNYKPGALAISAENRPVISYNQRDWHHLSDNEVSWNEADKELILTFTAKKNQVWVAHLPPYTNQTLNKLLAEYRDHPYFTMESIGKTAKNREIQLLTLTNQNLPWEGKKVIWILARQHAWEAGTSWVLEGALRHLLDSKEGKALLNSTVFKIIPMGDPDGVARGGVRFNAFGHDLNRNWDYVIPKEMPEIHAQKHAILAWKKSGKPIDIFLTLHNTKVDYVQGPDLPVGHTLLNILLKNSSLESETGLRKMPESTTLGKRGRMSVNQALWAEEKIPAYLMELNARKVEKLGGYRSIEDWMSLGHELTKALTHAVNR